MVKIVFRWLLRIFLGYLAIGVVYYFSGYFYNLVIGKQNIFSPIIGLPLTLIGWPQMLSADFIHREMLGVKPSMTITFLSILVVLVWIVRGIKHAKNK